MQSRLKPPVEFRNGYKNKKRLSILHDFPCVNCTAKGARQTTRTIAHHKIGMGLGKKASDLLTAAICDECHTGTKGIHNIPLWRWEDENHPQDELIEMTNKLLGKFN
jgi:hypothetical protein